MIDVETLDRTNLFDGINDAARRELATRSTLLHFAKDEVYRMYLHYRSSGGGRAVSSPSVGRRRPSLKSWARCGRYWCGACASSENRASSFPPVAAAGRADRDALTSLAVDDRQPSQSPDL